MTIRKKQPYGPVSSKKLKAFESTLVAPLPADFRTFLVEFNGAEFVGTDGDFGEDDDDEVDEEEWEDPSEEDLPLEDIFGLHRGPKHLRLELMCGSFQPTLPRSLLLIASDPYGNYYGMSLADSDRGVIYFIDHEAPSLDTQVASSFTELIEAAGIDIEPPPVPQNVAEAIEADDAVALQRFIEEGAPVQGHVFDAVRGENLEILGLVLGAGGDPNERGGLNDTETPLFHAARVDNSEIAALLLRHGADPNARCSLGGTAMEAATFFPSVLEVLARAGAEPTTRTLREAVQRILGSK
jgi:hypothetical protein